MYSTYYNGSSRIGNFNPYRHGVLMGNFVEDNFGQDLKEKYRCKSHQNLTRQIPLSENQDKYRWPVYKQNELKNYGNALTNQNANAFDFNIDFSKKNNGKKNLRIKTETDSLSNDKNIIYPEEFFAVTQQKKLARTTTDGFTNTDFNNNNSNTIDPNQDRNIKTESANRLGQLHLKNVKGILNTREQGQNGRMFFGHGLDFRKFGQNEYASTYQLCFNDKIRTETFYNPKFKVTKPFKFQPKTFYDNKDWNFRKFKCYNEFTKSIDKATILQK